MKISVKNNSPVVVYYTGMCVLALVGIYFSEGSLLSVMAVDSGMDFTHWLSWVKLVSYAFAHLNLQHLTGNILLLVLVGPILEEKYGSKKLLSMMLVTAVFTGLLQSLIFSQSLAGASGIVFMFIVLSSFTNLRRGEIPVTFILVLFLYIAQEVMRAMDEDQISQFAHLIGGAVGGVFGFLYNGKEKEVE